MGDHSVNSNLNNKSKVLFIKHLIDDIKALEIMLKDGLIESGITRIGSEQELCLVNNNWRPSNKAEKILEKINHPNFTTELALFNIEINLDPFELTSDCFTKVEKQLNTYLEIAREEANKQDVKIILSGVLPTISKNELELEFMTPNPRYSVLNNNIKNRRGKDFQLHIEGVDELYVIHDSILFEACSTSFQTHLQLDPDDFISSYNWAQAISGPVLGICCNSPIALGRELWRETRIALFQQSIDMRTSSFALKDQQARVTFGNSWAEGDITDIFKHDISGYSIILDKEIEKNSLAELNKGNCPKLTALSLHNSTIYRWNRPCYGVGGGKAHLRIENRYIPSGPTVIDELANFAFWVGLMKGRPKEYDDIPSIFDFRDAKENFFKAARTGKKTILNWFGENYSVRDLILKILLPISRKGLTDFGVNKNDIDRLLLIIEKRAKGITGAEWQIRNYRNLKNVLKKDDALLILTENMHKNQLKGIPVHEWPMIDVSKKMNENTTEVSHIMSTQIFTVNENDLASLALKIMKWKKIHHIPVETNSGEICGLLTWTHMKNYEKIKEPKKDIVVSEVMEKNLVTVTPKTRIFDTIELMKKHMIGCLPIVSEKQIVGIITIEDIIPFDNGKNKKQTPK